MAGSINIPGIGPVKTVYVVAGVALTGGILAFAYWRRAQQPAAAPAATDATATADTGSYVEGSDAAGYNTVYPSAYGQQFSQYGYDIYGNPLPAPTGLGSPGVFTTNNDWASAAETALENSSVTIAVSTTAISRVLAGLSVTSAQRDLFLQAVGLLGQPPQGYPTPIKLVDTPGNPAPTPVTTLAAPKGLKVTHADRTYVDIDWDPVPHATGYKIFVNGASKTSSLYTTHRVSRLSPNHAYKIGVAGVLVDPTGPGSADIAGPQATISTHTKR